MSIILSQLEAKSRTGAGKGPARRTRAEGLIPGVVYGKHLEKPLSIALNAKAVRTAVTTPKKLNTIIGLKIDGGAERMVLLKEYQLDPVSRELLHADFIDVRENEQVKVNVPLTLTGKAEGVANGGILSQMRRELEVWALPAAIPQSIDVDVTTLKIGYALHINDVKLPAGITVKTHVNYTLAVITAPEVEKVAEPTAAAAPAAGDAKAAAPAADGKAAPAKAGDAKAPAAAAKAPAKK
jgi:large subunit ribosomal protein L25